RRSRWQGLALTQESPRRLVGGSPGMVVRLRPTLPHRLRCSTIGAERLSFRVRNGTGRFPFAVTAETLWKYGPPPWFVFLPRGWLLTVSRELHSGREHAIVVSSCRLISTSQLHALLHVHIWPINPDAHWEPLEDKSSWKQIGRASCRERAGNSRVADWCE